jgi:prepilin-type processing-associated H-X9-DG protein
MKIKSFTLLELLVVIAVMGMLTTLLLPSLRRAKEASMSAVCKARLGQSGVAAAGYSKDNRMYYPGVTGGGDYSSTGALKLGGDTSEWKITLMPYLGLKAKEDNKKDIVFKCPMSNLVNYEPFKIWPKHGGGLAWSHGMGRVYYSSQGNALTSNNKPLVKPQQIEIPSESIMMGDTIDNPNKTKGVKAISSPTEDNSNIPVGNRHNNGMNILWTDLSVSWKAQNVLRSGKNDLIDYYYLMIKE